MPNALSDQEVRERLAKRGVELVGGYAGSQRPITVRCAIHGMQYEVRAHHFVCGGGMRCCQAEDARAQMAGRIVSEETRRRSSEAQSGSRAPWFGKRLSAEHRQAIKAGVHASYAELEPFIALARSGRTAGRRGHFYIARMESGLLKFGSTLFDDIEGGRLRYFGRQFGEAATLVLSALVPDAGAYEAAMMERWRPHWSHREFFHDFLAVA